MNILCAVLLVILSIILSAWINKDAAAVWSIGSVTGVIVVKLLERRT